MNDGKSAHVAIKRMMEAVFPMDMMTAVLKDSAEIRAMGRFSQTLIVRLAVVEGLKVLRARYAPDSD